MEVVCLISLHRILPGEDTHPDHVDEVDQVYPDDGHSCCDLSSCDDSESRDKKCEDDRTRVAHNRFTPDIEPRNQKGDRYDNREEYEDKSTIFLRGNGRICDIELHREEGQDDKSNERKSSSQTRDAVREVDTIEHEYIPKCRHKKGDIVDREALSNHLKGKKEVIKPRHSTEPTTDIANLDTRRADHEPYQYLHHEPKKWWYRETRECDSIEIIEEAHESEHRSEKYHDRELLIEGRGDIEKIGNRRSEYEERHHDGYAYSIWCGFSSFLHLVEVGSIEDTILFP